MLSRSNEQDLMTIARWARHDGTLLSLIDNPQYASEVKVLAVKNRKLSGRAIGEIVDRSNEYDKEVLIGAISNYNISRKDLVKLAQHHDLDVAIEVFRRNPSETSSLAFANDFIYDERLEISELALKGTIGFSEEYATQTILDRISEVKNPALVEVCVRSISNPVVLAVLVERADDSLLMALSKNRHLPSCVVQQLLSTQNEDQLLNLSKYSTLTSSQQEALLEKALKNNDLKLFHSLIENQGLSSEMLEKVINSRMELYQRFVNENMPHLSDELKENVIKSCQEQFASSLGYNKSVNLDFISEHFGLDVTPKRDNLLDMEGLSNALENSSLVEVYDLLEGFSHPELLEDDLLAVATQEDLDPDIKMTVLMGMTNRIGNSLQTLNSLQNELSSMGSNLAFTVGESSIDYQKNSKTFFPAPIHNVKSFVKTTYARIKKEVLDTFFFEGRHNNMRSLVDASLDRAVEVTVDASKKLYNKARELVPEVKRIKLMNNKKNKKGRRM